MHATLPLLENSDFPHIIRDPLEILQVNLGYLCNLSCVHCHVNAGPNRKELMDLGTVEQILTLLSSHQIKVLDLTGGAPEMNPHFRYLASQARKQGVIVIDRCNLVILQEPGYQDLADFLAQQQIQVTASLPCYLEDNVDKQRGKGVFDASIIALKKLNQLGYGQADSGLELNLVFNPQGDQLPPAQQPLEDAYKMHLREHFGIVFNKLYAVTNMPIQRFGSTLISQGRFDSYMQLLKDNYQAENLAGLMCRNTLSIDWQGYVYDCDFNQMLNLPLGANQQKTTHISALNDLALTKQPISVRQHCYGCTAGQGSSCGGALD
jgi:radical SAM/Cys-rich protein